MTQALLITLAVAFALAMPSEPAFADDPTVEGGESALDVSYTTSEDVLGQSNPTNISANDSPFVRYDQKMFCSRDPALADFYGCGGPAECGDEGTAYNVYGIEPDGSEVDIGTYCDEPGEVAPESPGLTLTLVREAFQQVPLPASKVTVEPPGGRTLVNISTILSTQAEPFVESVALLGQTVRLDIEPVSFHWVHGDGSEQRSDWPGIAYAESRPMDAYLTHTYLRASRDVPVRVDTTWSARFSVNGGPWRPVPDTVTVQGTAVRVDVVEASPVLVGYN